MNINKFYYINLEKRPNRNEHFLNQCTRENIPPHSIQRFAGIDGTSHIFTEEELVLLRKTGNNTNNTTKKIMGNQLSHHYIMKDIIKNKYPFSVVFQDDAILKESFLDYIKGIVDNFPKDAEMLNIGFHKICVGAHFLGYDLENDKTEDFLCRIKVNDHIVYLNHGINPCSLAYIITLKGAENIINHFENIGYTDNTDNNYNTYLANKNIFYGPTRVLVTGNHKFPSDIFLN